MLAQIQKSLPSALTELNSANQLNIQKLENVKKAHATNLEQFLRENPDFVILKTVVSKPTLYKRDIPENYTLSKSDSKTYHEIVSYLSEK